MRKIFLFTGLLSCAAAAVAAESHALRQGQAHVHGKVLLNIAIEDGIVAVELASPAVNLLGFEHSPSTPEELALVETTGARLRDHAALVEFTSGACVQTDVAAEFPFAGDGDADHRDEQEHEDHGDIHLRYHLQCRSDEALELRFRAFADFPGIEEVVVQWVSETGQGGALLTPDSASFRMEPIRTRRKDY